MRPLLFFLLIVCLGSQAFGQQPRVIPIPHQDQLPVRAIHRIMQDSEGYIWLGTFDGLARYDGYEMHTFRSSFLTPHLLRSNYITCLMEDTRGDIWVGTQRGLYILRRRDCQLRPVALGDDSEASVFTLSRMPDSTVWVSVVGGLYHLTTDGRRLRYIATTVGGKPRAAYFVYQLPDGRAITSFDDAGMYTITGSRLRPYAHTPMAPRFVERIVPIDRDNYYLATWGQGIVRFNTRTLRYTPQTATQGAGAYIFHTAQSSDSLMYTTTTGGLFAYLTGSAGLIPATARGHTLAAVAGIKPALPVRGATVYEICRDREGMLWVSSFDQPSFIIDPGQRPLRFDSLCELRRTFRRAPNVVAMTYDTDSTLWLSTSQGGLQAGDVNYKDGLAGLPLYYTKRLTPSRAGGVWVVAADGNIYHLQLKDGRMSIVGERIRMDVEVLDLLEDSRGHLWIGTKRDYTALCELPPRVGPQRGVWGARADGLLVNLTRPDTLRLPEGEKVTHMTPGWHNLWMTTESGRLLCYNFARRDFDEHTSMAGLDGEHLNALVVDQLGHIWISTPQYLREYAPQGWTLHTYATVTDHPMLRLTEGCLMLTAGSEVMAGGVGGLLRVAPTRELDTRADTVRTVVTDVVTDGQSRLADGLTRDSLGHYHIALQPYERNIEVRFSTLRFRHIEGVRYAYREQRRKPTEWRFIEGGRNTAFLSHLAPGRHTIEVHATDPEGRWSPAMTLLTIDRRAAWHETWWARTLLIVGLLLAAGLGLERWRRERQYQRLRRQLREQLDEKTETVSLTSIEVKDATSEMVSAAIAIVERNLGDATFTVERFAQEMCMSKATLSRRLKAATGHSPATFVREIRMRHAAQLLATGQLSVAEVAQRVGYNDAPHFSVRFRQAYGRLPSEMKNER